MLPGFTSRFLPTLLFLFVSLAAFGQRPTPSIAPNPGKAGVAGLKMDCNDAGEPGRFFSFDLESNSFGDNIAPGAFVNFAARPDTIFLCAQDAFSLEHISGTEDLSGDPQPGTAPGVAWGFYACAPTVAGPTYADILADPCVADGGLSPFDGYLSAIPAGVATGNYNLRVANDGTGNNTIPSFFPDGNGDPSPIVLDIAPITYDVLSAAQDSAFYENDGMGGPSGPCVNVNIAGAFRVAYLNPLAATNLMADNAGCTGSFTVRGGAPELRGNAGYRVEVVNLTTNSRASLSVPNNQLNHNGTVSYTVPEPGQYFITITDDITCTFTSSLISHSGACAPEPVKLIFPVATAPAGSTACYPVTVADFTNVAGIDFELNFDPAVLSFTGTNNPNPNLTSALLVNGPPSSGGTRPNGTARFIYDGSATGDATIPDGGVFLELCFQVIGALGTQSPITANAALGPEYTRFGNSPSIETGSLMTMAGSITVTAQDFVVTTTRVSETCDTRDDGMITVTASNTTGPLTFAIRRVSPNPQAMFGGDQTSNTAPATVTFSDLPDGIYEIRVRNGAGGEMIQPVTIDRGLSLDVSVMPVNRPTCNGDDDGSVRAVVFANGIEVTNPSAAGYTFVWDGFPATGDILTGLMAGSYQVTVTAPNGVCMAVASGGLSQPLPISVRPDNPADAVSSATCDGAPDGSIEITADGGFGPYDFFWPAGLGTDTDVTAAERMNLLPGAYAVTVVDTRGCSEIANFVVDAEKSLIITAATDSVTCFGDDNGVIRVSGSVTGAPRVGSFFVTLTNLTTGVSGTEMRIPNVNVPFEFTGLAPGTYTVTLRDEDPAMCSITETFEVGGPDLLEFTDDLAIRDETCEVGMDGTVSANVTGGTGPYVFRFQNDELDDAVDTITPGPFLDGLEADSNYVLTVTDARGCTITASFLINAPAAAQISPIATSTISCPGDMDGQLMATITDPPGETVVSVTWYVLNADSTLGAVVANGPLTQANLRVGLYVVEVITSNGCVNFGVGAVTSPSAVFLQDFTLDDPACPGDANGSISLSPGGGTPNADGSYTYTFSTNPGVTTQNPTLSGLAAGAYSVTIVDGNNCQPAFDTTFTLVDPPAITGEFVLTPVSCPDDNVMDGTATFTAAYEDGTQGVFDFTWSTGATDDQTTSSTITGLGRGQVTVTVGDGTCTRTFTATITSPDEFTTEIVTEAVSCNGQSDGTATLLVTGGTGAYTYEWTGQFDNDNTVENLSAGTYQVVVTDANGCSPPPVTFQITQPDPLRLAIDSTMSTETVSCAGDMDGRITVFVSSLNNNDLGDEPYTWSDGVAPPSSPVATGLAPGNYSVTVTDVRGCQDMARFSIGEPDSIVFSVLPIEEPPCFGETTPIMIDTAFGGTSTGFGDFTFSVNNDGFRVRADVASDAFAGDISVTVFDAAGCSAEQVFNVGQPPQILIDLEEEITIELGDSLTRLNPTISPAGDLYNYLWTPSEALSSDSVRNPVIFPLMDRLYTLTVTNMSGCQAVADIFVNVDANRNVYIPNVFSPNQDGRNEDFRVFACQGVQRLTSVRVFDRWGGLVYEADDVLPNCLDGTLIWNGTSADGRTMNPGVFVYMVEVEFLDNVRLTYRGDVTLLR